MKRLLLAALAAFFLANLASAQQVVLPQCEVSSTGKSYTAGTVRPCIISPSGETFVTQGASGAYTSDATITRETNTTTYTANTAFANDDTAATYSTFASVCRAAGAKILIPQIDIRVDENPATKLQGILWLFNAVVSNAIEDNATFVIPVADQANLTGNWQGFPFTLTNNGASGATYSGVSLTGTTYTARCASGATSLYGMVQVVNAYVPTSAEVMTIRLHAVSVN